MSATPGSAITLTVVFFAGVLSATSARAQDASASSLADQLKTQYKLTKISADTSITEAGTVLVIQTEGILGVPPGSVDLCPATYKDGALHTPSTEDIEHCGKEARKLNTYEKVYVLKIDLDSKRDRVSLLIVECGSCNGATQLASYKSSIIFQFPNGWLAAAEAGQIEDVISQVLTNDNGTKEAQQHVPGGKISAPGLPNEEIIKLVQAKLPDSVVIAKIESSSSEFDASTDALIKLKKVGASDLVLQAIVDASAAFDATISHSTRSRGPGTRVGSSPPAAPQRDFARGIAAQ